MSEPEARADRCKTCRYWHNPEPEDAEDGQCRRYAPRPVVDTSKDETDTIVAWPMVMRVDWCGEWAPLPVQQTEG